jgi:hypothetical protein
MELNPSLEATSRSGTQELQKFYRTLRFITIFTSALHCLCSDSDKSIPYYALLFLYDKF